MEGRSRIVALALGGALVAGFGQRLPGAEVARPDALAQALSARRVFGEPIFPLSPIPSQEEDVALGHALDLYLAKGDPLVLEPLQAFLAEHPHSAWGPSLLLNLGNVYQWYGYPGRALATWREAWNLAQGAQDPHGVGDRIAGNLARQLARAGRVTELQALLAQLRQRPVQGSAATLVAEAGGLLDSMIGNSRSRFRCGPVALENLAEAMEQGERVRNKTDALDVGSDGASLAQVLAWAKEMGLPLQGVWRAKGSAIPVPSILFWRLGHFSVVTQRRGDQFLVRGFLDQGDRWLMAESIEEETGSVVLVPAAMFLKTGWRVATDKELAEVRGTGGTSGLDPMNPKKGPIPLPEQCHGMPVYSLLPAQASVEINDTPLWYSPPIGPSVQFHLTFNNTDVQQPSTFTFWNMGAKWTSDWLSYIIDDPANPGVNTTLYQRGGGIASYSGYNPATCTFAPQFYNQDILVRTSATSYERRLPDGSKEEFTIPDGAIAPRHVFMTRVVDPSGNALTLAYDASLRLTSVTDALGQVTSLSYAGSDPLKVTKVTDPFGRSTTLQYGAQTLFQPSGSYSYTTCGDQSGSFLAAITDMGGLTSTFQYASNVACYSYPSSNTGAQLRIVRSAKVARPVTLPYTMSQAQWLAYFRDNCGRPPSGTSKGTTALAIRPTALLSSAAATSISNDDAWSMTYDSGSGIAFFPICFPFISGMATPYGTTTFACGQAGSDQFIQATDPLGQSERIEYHNFTGEMPGQDAVAPPGFDNELLYYRNSFYWDKRAMTQGAGDWTLATIYHFLHSSNDPGTTSPTLESLKNPLESRVWNGYGQTWEPTYKEQYSSLPNTVARVLDDGTSQVTQTQYNAVGHPVQVIDPTGRITTYAYSADGVDLLQVANTTGGQTAVLATYTYNTQHRPLTVTDAAGQTTTMTYNEAGQVTSITDPLGETTTLSYSPASGGFLTQISGALPGSSTLFGYDALGRLNSVTDPQGRTVVTEFDNLDRPTRINYPDGTSEVRLYTNLDPTAVQDRAGNWTSLAYNPLRQLIQVQDPAQRITQLGWCNCGSLEQLTDPMGRITNWWRDLEGRVIGKRLDDGTQTNYGYDSAGRMIQRIDAMGQTTLYGYGVDNNLGQVSYPDALIPTPAVNYTYDPNFNRLVTMADGFGTTVYSYYPITSTPALGAGRLATVTSPLPNSTITYSYDVLGRVIQRDINGTAEVRAFDALGRISAVANPLGTFGYAYLGGTNNLSAISLPNGQTTQFTYFGAAQDYRLNGIAYQRADGSVISAFGYAYNPNGTIRTWSRQADANLPQAYTFSYDPVNQLVGAVLSDSAGVAIHQYTYGYDLAGNRTSAQVDTTLTETGFNDTNQMTQSNQSTTTTP